MSSDAIILDVHEVVRRAEQGRQRYDAMIGAGPS